MRLSLRVAIWFALMTFAPYAWSQGYPVGPEFRVNTYTVGNQQSRRAVSSDSAGNFVVAWISEPDSAFDIWAQRFASTGIPLGTQFRVNSYSTGGQLAPSVASSSAGSFVVAWQSFNQDGSSTGTFAQRFAATGAPLGGAFRVNTFTTSAQFYPQVASDSVGNFVIVWNGYTQDGSGTGVFAQRFASTGTPLGAEFRVNTFTPGPQSRAVVASSPGGDFVVAWQSEGQAGPEYAIFAQRFASTGAPLGGEFRVSNTYTTSVQSRPAVALDAAGNFVVVWQRAAGPFAPPSLFPIGVMAQRYASTGLPLGGEFRVNSYNTPQYWPAVASDPTGNLVVTWSSWDGSQTDVVAQRFMATGAPLGGQFRVNTFTPNGQGYPGVASDAAGHFVIVWDSHLQEPSGYSIYGQRFSMIVPVELQSFRVE